MGSILSQSVFERVLNVIGHNKVFRMVPGAEKRLKDGLCLELDSEDGYGSVMMHQFDNGLQVGRSNHFRFNPKHLTYKNMHTYFGFTIVLDGYSVMEVPQIQQKVMIKPGEIAFRRGHVKLVNQILPAGVHLRGLMIDLPGEMVEAWQSEVPERINKGLQSLLQDTPTPYFRVFRANEAILARAEKMMNTDVETSFGRMQYEAAALNLLADLIDPGAPSVAHLTRSQIRQGQLQKSLDQAVEILRLEWSAPPTIAELARQVGLNERTLRDEFRKRLGMTIGEYQREQRMTRARELIEINGLGVHEAALHVGYSNPSHFSNAFKKHYGYLPSSLRRSL